MKYTQPQNLGDALELLTHDSWSILSGGTDFYPSLGDKAVTENVLDIWSLDELRSINKNDGFIRIGALVTWTDIVKEDLPESFDGLKLAALEVGSIQIQNRATLVGNICNASPAADGVPPMLSLSAEVELMSGMGTRRLPLEEFILGNRSTALRPNELVSAILIPDNAARGKSTFLKLGSRKYLVISISMVAARLVIDEQQRVSDIAISVGSCSLVAQRMTLLEQALMGQVVDADLGSVISNKHLATLSPIDDVRASKDYRLDASREILRRVLTELGGSSV